MHPCVPFCSDAPIEFLVHPSVHRVHRLKSTALKKKRLGLTRQPAYAGGKKFLH